MPTSKETRELLEAYKQKCLEEERLQPKATRKEKLSAFGIGVLLFSIVVLAVTISTPAKADTNVLTPVFTAAGAVSGSTSGLSNVNTNVVLPEAPGYVTTQGNYSRTETRLITKVEYTIEKGFHDVVVGTVTETHGYAPVVVK